jgi:hypothetical protein
LSFSQDTFIYDIFFADSGFGIARKSFQAGNRFSPYCRASFLVQNTFLRSVETFYTSKTPEGTLVYRRWSDTSDGRVGNLATFGSGSTQDIISVSKSRICRRSLYTLLETRVIVVTNHRPRIAFNWRFNGENSKVSSVEITEGSTRAKSNTKDVIVTIGNIQRKSNSNVTLKVSVAFGSREVDGNISYRGRWIFCVKTSVDDGDIGSNTSNWSSSRSIPRNLLGTSRLISISTSSNGEKFAISCKLVKSARLQLGMD